MQPQDSAEDAVVPTLLRSEGGGIHFTQAAAGVGLGVGAGAVRPGEGFLEAKTRVRGRRMREFPEEERAGQGVEATHG